MAVAALRSPSITVLAHHASPRMLTAQDTTIERDAHQCTWTYQHRRCPEMIEPHVHKTAKPDGEDRTLCDRHKRELQASEHRRLVRLGPSGRRTAP